MKHSFVKIVCCNYTSDFEREINQTMETSEELGYQLRDIKFLMGETSLFALMIFDATE